MTEIGEAYVRLAPTERPADPDHGRKIPASYDVTVSHEKDTNVMPWRWEIRLAGKRDLIEQGWTDTRWGAGRQAKRAARRHARTRPESYTLQVRP